MAATTTIQVASISTALVAAGGIASFSIFHIPLLQSQPASRSLPLTRWLFSRGSHIFPQAAFLSGAGFAYLAYDALPLAARNLGALLQGSTYRGKVAAYLAAAALAISIGPFTARIMVPNNFALIRMNEAKGGARSERSAKVENEDQPKDRSAEDSVQGQGQAEELTDLSGPQEKTRDGTTDAEDREVRERLDVFYRQNMVRAVLLGSGGVLGLVTALT